MEDIYEKVLDESSDSDTDMSLDSVIDLVGNLDPNTSSPFTKKKEIDNVSLLGINLFVEIKTLSLF